MENDILQEELNCISSITTLGTVIITSWEIKLRQYLGPDHQESELILIDHIPEILLNLKLHLEGKNGDGDALDIGKAHGFQRALLTNFNLVDLMKEYSILREVLIFNLYPIGNMKGATKLHRFLDDLLIHAAEEFIKHKSPDSACLSDVQAK